MRVSVCVLGCVLGCVTFHALATVNAALPPDIASNLIRMMAMEAKELNRTMPTFMPPDTPSLLRSLASDGYHEAVNISNGNLHDMIVSWQAIYNWTDHMANVIESNFDQSLMGPGNIFYGFAVNFTYVSGSEGASVNFTLVNGVARHLEYGWVVLAFSSAFASGVAFPQWYGNEKNVTCPSVEQTQYLNSTCLFRIPMYCEEELNTQPFQCEASAGCGDILYGEKIVRDCVGHWTDPGCQMVDEMCESQVPKTSSLEIDFTTKCGMVASQCAKPLTSNQERDIARALEAKAHPQITQQVNLLAKQVGVAPPF